MRLRPMRSSILLIILISTIALMPFSFAADEVYLHVFYGQGCPHCEKAIAFLDEINEKYPDLNIILYEVYFNNENRELFMHYCSELEQSAQGVPTIFIDDKTFVGFSNELAFQLEEKIKECLEQGCGDIAEKCSLNGHLKGEFDPVNPISGSHYSIIGWAFIFIFFAAIAFVIIRKYLIKS